MTGMDSVDNILYVKSINSEWKLDAEVALPLFRERCESLVEIQSKGSAWSYLSNLTLSKYNLDCQSPEISKFIEAQSPWKIILSNSQEKLAVLQDSHVEIRSADNDFTEVLHKWTLPARDLFPQWRNLAWSPCDSLLAFSDSHGNVFLYGVNGDQLSHVFQPKNQSCDLGNAVCSLVFKGRRSMNQQIDDHQHWLHELLVISYQGLLNTFIISQEGDHRLLHSFNFDGGFPNGVVDAVYVSTSNLLLVGGGTFWKNGVRMRDGEEEEEEEMSRSGISAWRVLADCPYYKLVSDYELESKTKTFPSTWWPWSANQNGDKVVKMAVSPDQKTLVSVHSSENICIWSLPSLRLFKKFSLQEQPDRDYVDPDILDNPKKRKIYKDLLNAFYVVSLAWWSNEDVIISRGTGSLTVSNIKNLANRLGDSPEFFRSEMNLMRFSDGCFYVLECQKRRGTKRDAALGENEDEAVSEFTSSDSDEENFEGQAGGLVAKLVRQSLYYITDLDAFQPPKKRSRLMRRIYRMMCLKSTTPEELYSNMLDGEEYGEALLLARKYNLDCDLTYQRQWKKSPVTVSSIQDYLRKITKRSWVLHECLETVPVDLDAMEELLQYGLRGTDLEAVVAAGRHDDDGRFIFCESKDDYKPMDGEEDGMNEGERRKDLLKQISFQDLTLNQKELCRIRLKLLQYLDKLETYQNILGGRHLAIEKYDRIFFKKFRKENIVELAVEFAQLSDVAALGSLFTYHGDETLPHRLAILCNIPETTPADVFSHLLPKIRIEGDKRVVEEWEESKWRCESDWSEEFCSSLKVASPDDDPGEFLYKENPDLLEFRGRSLSGEQLTSWFKRRSLEIEKLSGQVDCATTLLQYGIQSNIQGLEALHEDFTLMEVLVYECHVPPSFDFNRLLKMSRMERIRLMMTKTTREMYAKNLRRWVVPYLEKQEMKVAGSYFSLLKQYMMEMAADDLTFVDLIFKESRPDKPDAIIRDVHDLFSIASECLYAHNSYDQLCLVKSIIDSLPDLNIGSEECHLRMSMVNHHLGAEILKKNGIEKTLAEIRDIQDSESDTARILTRLARVSAQKTPPMSHSELEHLLTDMCSLQKDVFTKVSRSETCEIFVGALLCSGNVSHIILGGKVMDSSYDLPASSQTLKIPTSKSVRSSLKDSFRSLTTGGSASPQHSATSTPDFLRCTIDRSKSIELVLRAAKEYFNSSPDFLHENMKLARCCLELIRDRPPEVQEELNLIEALAMLKFHGVSEFPAHLRIAEDRLKYVKDVLVKKSMMYKNYSKLLELGKLLNIGKGDEELLQGKIFDLIAQQALEAKDYTISLDACKKLMSLNYEAGWKVCKSLAEDEGFQDDLSKFNLFNFVLLHSPDCHVRGVLDSLSKLQVKSLCLQVTKGMNSVEPSLVQGTNENEGSMKSIENVLVGQTKQVLNLTRAAFDHVGDSRWWSGVVSDAASGLKKLTAPGTKDKRRRRKMNESFRSGSIDKEMGNYFTKQTFHPFYESLNRHHSSATNEEIDYLDIYMAPETNEGRNEGRDESLVDINELLLQIYLLNKCDNDAKSSHLLTQVLLVLAENVLPKDTSLGLSYLLALPDAFSAEKCFDRLPKTPLCYQLAVYYFALKIAFEMKTSGKSLPWDFHSVPPEELVAHVRMRADESDRSSEGGKMLERMFFYQNLLLDYQESETLKNMGRGIDTTRFVSDESYKKETILGMALTLDDQVLSAALKLASKYELMIRDVYMAHLSFLFEDSSGLRTEEIERRIKELKMLKVLNENPAWFSKTLQEQILPLIEGCDLNRLLVYYSCLVPEENQFDDGEKLDSCQKKEDIMEAKDGTKPLMHIKMLRKFKNVALGINYKDLFSGRCDVEKVLDPILDANNVAVFAKYSANFVDKSGKVISPSFVNKCFASKIFNAPMFENEVDWVARYKDCSESIHALSPDVLIEFINENLFGIRALKKVPVESRKQILKGLMKHSKQQLSLAKKANQQKNSESWEETVKILQRDLDHLNRMSTKIISKLLASENLAWQQYARDFDLTQSRVDEVKNLFKQIILKMETLEFVEEVVKNLSPQELQQQQQQDLYVEVLQELCSTSQTPDSEDSLQKIKCIIGEISRHSAKGGSLVSINEVCSHVKEFISSSDVDPHFKLQILSIIKESSPMKDNDDDDDGSDMLYSQTCAVLSMLDHHDIQLTPDRISQASERILIFNRLLESLTSLDELSILIHLLDNWPPVEKSENLWCKLLKKMLNEASTSGGAASQCVLQHVQETIEKGHLDEKEIVDLTDLIKDPLFACKVLLSSSNKELINRALLALKSMLTELKDKDLFIILLKQHLLPQCTDLPFYNNLLDFMLTYDSSPVSSRTDPPSLGVIPSALDDLSASGKKAEAGTFFMSWISVHRSLRTFDAAMNFADKFLSK